MSRPRHRAVLALAAPLTLFLTTALPLSVSAHHGWSWTKDGNVELTGTITQARLGNPHGVLTVSTDEDATAEGEDGAWTVEVGQPWRNERAGLTDAMLAPGQEITVIGQASRDPAERRLKAERVLIGGEVHDLYPGRD